MKKGFTLIELLIVITIVGILAVVFLPSILGSPSKARDAARKADVTSIVKALSAARVAGVSLPAAGNYCVDGTTLSNYASYFGGGVVPLDPLSTNELDGSANNDCTSSNGNNGKYLLRVYTAALETLSGGFKFGVFAKMEKAENANMRCTYVGASSGSPLVHDPIGFLPPYDCYGVKSQ